VYSKPSTEEKSTSTPAPLVTGQNGRRPTPARNTNRAKQMEEERGFRAVSCVGVRLTPRCAVPPTIALMELRVGEWVGPSGRRYDLHGLGA
jgi:hypothetical protein